MPGLTIDRDRLKRAAAARAVEFAESGMVLGLGTGSTSAFAIEALAARIAGGLDIVAIATSERSAAQARRLGIPLTSFAEHPRLDLTIDGADQVERATLDLLKGRGGALLREKIVAAASERYLVIVDQEKLALRLGEHIPVPVEVAQFGWQATAASLAGLGCEPALRGGTGAAPFVTDGGNFILDCRFGPIADPPALERRINLTVGVIENGLFTGRSSAVIVASEGGIEILEPAAQERQ